MLLPGLRNPARNAHKQSAINSFNNRKKNKQNGEAVHQSRNRLPNLHRDSNFKARHRSDKTNREIRFLVP